MPEYITTYNIAVPSARTEPQKAAQSVTSASPSTPDPFFQRGPIYTPGAGGLVAAPASKTVKR